MKRRSARGSLAGLVVAVALGAAVAPPAPAAEPVRESLAQELARGFYWRANVLTYALAQELEDSPFNPLNVLELSAFQLVLNPRVDLDLVFRRWEFSLKPRGELRWDHRDEFDEALRQDESRTESDLFINEGFVRLRPVDELLLSYGRENLQWGPSAILSSSNPFNRSNGRSNPKIELPGLDYARAIWIPSMSWSLSLISNTGAGRLDEDEDNALANLLLPLTDPVLGPRPLEGFERTHAFKLDYTGASSYFSVIPSYREHDEQYGLGFFGGWNASEALLLYAEGSAKGHEDEEGKRRRDEILFQAGAAYTLAVGPTVTFEYLRNHEGCDRDSLSSCVFFGEIDVRAALFPSADVLYRDYALLQITDSELVRDLSVSLRLIGNLNDHSERLTGIFEYAAGDHAQLYLIGNWFIGGADTEFGSLLRYAFFMGFGYTF